MEVELDPSTLKSYVQQYTGNSRFTRLLSLADKQKSLRIEAIKLCLEMAKAEKKIFFYFEAVKYFKRLYSDTPDACPIQDFGQDQNFERTVHQEYKNEVRKKEQEIQQLQKSLLRDSMRIAFNDLGKIHYQYGFLNEAIKAWVKSHDFSTSEDDLFNMAYAIAQAAFENLSTSYLIKYSGESDARDKGKNPTKTMLIKTLDALASLLAENHKDAAIKLSNISITDEQALLQFISPRDLAYYTTLTALFSMNRKEMKEQILSSSNYKNLTEVAPETTDIIENFLNGRYTEFQKSLALISQKLKFDVFFGHKIYAMVGTIRKKALVQYVTPYKVIDMREIAKAFDLSIEQIEYEIADLIVSKKIQAKIDSHSKLLYSRKDNETMNSYKEAVQLGRKFIQETEAALLRIQALQKSKTLKPQSTALSQAMSAQMNQ